MSRRVALILVNGEKRSARKFKTSLPDDGLITEENADVIARAFVEELRSLKVSDIASWLKCCSEDRLYGAAFRDPDGGFGFFGGPTPDLQTLTDMIPPGDRMHEVRPAFILLLGKDELLYYWSQDNFEWLPMRKDDADSEVA